MQGRELEDLLVSFLVLLLLFSDFSPKLIPYVTPALFTAFVLHELAHRQVARYFGYYSYYKRWDLGIALALIFGMFTKLLTGSTWVFAAVGSVYIYAPYQYWVDKRSEGIIALSGPITNIIVAILGYVLIKVISLGSWFWILYYMTKVNAWLAFFNLLPFPPLDGFKVFRWNVSYWAIVFGVSFMLYYL
ncbi:site-2 protease family protein [Pyrococcus abyssi]|uniref:Metalloprotease n=1 Tax=Pyrococcus abyssi (strain GE5 / Orsay) TaxID=272844 RepID=Q9UYD6_PYRAB|nr:site-2 protease family protein [Pyrococcus abyssi]CAB50476.1 Putative peptidase, family M50 [Pyrococcus abyssi GE5]CCE71029.1 TPA: Metalloprotease [Pyrococcus abyssi GE5]